jgi:hypothetical protein
MRNSVPACMLSNSWPVKPLADARRTCSSMSGPSDGALAIESASAALRQHDVDVLTGPEMQRLDGRQAQEHRHYVVGNAFEPIDAARQALDLDVRRRTHLGPRPSGRSPRAPGRAARNPGRPPQP